MKMTEKLILEKKNHTAFIVIKNPPANTWDLESLSLLHKIIDKLNENKDIYSLVVTGYGEKFFSAGADLKVFQEGSKDASLLPS